MENIRILICDDHTIVSHGLANYLKSESTIKNVCVCTSGQSTLKKFSEEIFELAILDVNMDEMSGLRLATKLRLHYPSTKIIMLSMRSDLLTVKECIKAGASGYLVKNTDINEILLAIKNVLNGKMYFSKEIEEALEYDLVDTSNINSTELFITPREREILMLIIKEYNSKQIADKLCISENTVESHRKNIMRKTNTKTSIGLVRYAIERGLV
ncbi:MAG: DNA-binding response regulator [Bacteroidetes bacterium]|nr:MAG: DNA-binding response regulator [Bacteroidota bacterium]